MMFNLVKSWFKRPVVINFNVETIPDDAKVCVLTTQRELSKAELEAIQSQLSGFTGLKFVIISKGVDSLQALSSEDLKAIGLIRADFGGGV